MSAFADMLVFEMSKKGYQHIVLQTVSRGIIFRQFCRRKVHGNAAVRAGWQRRRRDGASHMTKAAHARASPCAAQLHAAPSQTVLPSPPGCRMTIRGVTFSSGKCRLKHFPADCGAEPPASRSGGKHVFPLNEQPGAHFTKRRRLPGHGAGVFAEYSSRFFKNRRLRGRTLLHSTS